jgi:trypsin
MRVLRLASTVLIGLAATMSPALGQERHNWMREYVELRVQAMTARALGPNVMAPAAESRIVGGTIAAPGSNPFQVGLLTKSIKNNFRAQYCGGSLIRANVVVTAAHCSDFVRARQVQVLTGARRLDGSGTRRGVQRIIIHPSWNPRTFNNDVAVWILNSSATGIPLALLASTDPAVGTSLLATGWGNTETSGYPVDLMQVFVPLVSPANCNDANSYNGAVTAEMICAGYDAGGADTCQGDSGGPLTHRGASNTFRVLTGITSWGEGCADPNFFGVYTRVSQFRTWILSQLP